MTSDTDTQRVIIVVPAKDTQRSQELEQLVESAGATVCAVLTTPIKWPVPATFLRAGKLAELKSAVLVEAPDLIVFGLVLTPIQERNIEREIACRVIDRARLILDIFASRAHSAAGALQVELAQLEYLATRLVRGWSHLERQRGGIGLRGPGEKQLETDRRLLGKRVSILNKKITSLHRQRQTQRRSRQRHNAFSVSLVGYTNAGKSTLFNALTKADVYVQDQLFATLDTTTRRAWLGENHTMLLSDTVGFIDDLPHALIDAFHATLEETCEADLILHVVDSSDRHFEEKITIVNNVLNGIGAGNIAQIMVFNKIDLLTTTPQLRHDTMPYVRLSAHTKHGFSDLRTAIKSHKNRT